MYNAIATSYNTTTQQHNNNTTTTQHNTIQHNTTTTTTQHNTTQQQQQHSTTQHNNNNNTTFYNRTRGQVRLKRIIFCYVKLSKLPVLLYLCTYIANAVFVGLAPEVNPTDLTHNFNLDQILISLVTSSMLAQCISNLNMLVYFDKML
jgi:hypothetical protein